MFAACYAKETEETTLSYLDSYHNLDGKPCSAIRYEMSLTSRALQVEAAACTNFVVPFQTPSVTTAVQAFRWDILVAFWL